MAALLDFTVVFFVFFFNFPQTEVYSSHLFSRTRGVSVSVTFILKTLKGPKDFFFFFF